VLYLQARVRLTTLWLIFVAVLGPGVRREAEGRDRVAAAAADQGPGPGGGLVEGGIGQGSSDKLSKYQILIFFNAPGTAGSNN